MFHPWPLRFQGLKSNAGSADSVRVLTAKLQEAEARNSALEQQKEGVEGDAQEAAGALKEVELELADTLAKVISQEAEMEAYKTQAGGLEKEVATLQVPPRKMLQCWSGECPSVFQCSAAHLQQQESTLLPCFCCRPFRVGIPSTFTVCCMMSAPCFECIKRNRNLPHTSTRSKL